MKILIINGPNLNMLGKRSPGIYGAMTLNEICEEMEYYANQRDMLLAFFQSNVEGEIIDHIHGSVKSVDGIVINAGAYSHTSIAIRDAIESIEIPAVEVHISNIFGREGFRRRSHIAPVCVGSISGFGYLSYILALEYFFLNQRT